MKPYDIEVQRLKSMKHDKGMIEIGIDALVLPRPARDDQVATSCLSLSVEQARTLLILLKQQIAELDKLQPRSRRSGRACSNCSSPSVLSLRTPWPTAGRPVTTPTVA